MHMCIRQGEIERAKAVDFNFEGLEINPAPQHSESMASAAGRFIFRLQ